ncbi:hypothetical protein R6Z07F_018046 [Ovis aries]
MRRARASLPGPALDGAGSLESSLSSENKAPYAVGIWGMDPRYTATPGMTAGVNARPRRPRHGQPSDRVLSPGVGAGVHPSLPGDTGPRRSDSGSRVPEACPATRLQALGPQCESVSASWRTGAVTPRGHGARAAQLQNQDRWDQSETPAGPRSVRSAEGRPRALRSFRGRWRPAAVSAFAPRGLRSVRRPLSASLVTAVGLASPTLLSSRAPPPPQGPRGPSRGGSLPAWLWDLLLKQEMRGLGPHCRTSARPLLYSWRTRAGKGLRFEALPAPQGVDIQVPSRAVQEGRPPGGSRQSSLAEMESRASACEVSPVARGAGGACPDLGQGCGQDLAPGGRDGGLSPLGSGAALLQSPQPPRTCQQVRSEWLSTIDLGRASGSPTCTSSQDRPAAASLVPPLPAAPPLEGLLPAALGPHPARKCTCRGLGLCSLPIADPPGEQPSRAGRVRAPETSVPGSAKLRAGTPRGEWSVLQWAGSLLPGPAHPPGLVGLDVSSGPVAKRLPTAELQLG